MDPSTRSVHAGLPEPAQGEPFLPGPVLSAPVHWAGPGEPGGYARFGVPTWAHLERALSELEGGGEAVAFASGQAAVSAVLLAVLEPGDVLTVVVDGYPGVRKIALEHLAPRGVEVRQVRTRDEEVLAAVPGARMVWVESPSNPGLDVLDLPRLAAGCADAGALLAVDSTLATPLRQPLTASGAAISVVSGTKALTGHSDLLLGYVCSSRAPVMAQVRAWRDLHGAVPGPFEAWLAHRSIATAGLRIERQEVNAAALAEALRGVEAVTDVRWPGIGSVVCFEVRAGGEAAEAFIERCALVANATSFGGVHSTAERRARWGTDDVAEGFVRFSCGIEGTQDLLDDVLAALG